MSTKKNEFSAMGPMGERDQAPTSDSAGDAAAPTEASRDGNMAIAQPPTAVRYPIDRTPARVRSPVIPGLSTILERISKAVRDRPGYSMLALVTDAAVFSCAGFADRPTLISDLLEFACVAQRLPETCNSVRVLLTRASRALYTRVNRYKQGDKSKSIVSCMAWILYIIERDNARCGKNKKKG